MIADDKIIAFLKANGPSIPVHMVKELKQDTIIIGAMLSALAGTKKLIISNTKIGGSPLYYLKEDEAKLQDFAKYLNEKDQRAYELLKEKKVLRDKEMTPLLRVSLRAIKDFAKPVTVTVGGQNEIFWKWYLIKSDESEKHIRAFFGKQEKETTSKKELEGAQKKEAEKSLKAVSSVLNISVPAQKQPIQPEPKGFIVEQKKSQEKEVSALIKSSKKKSSKYELEEEKSLIQARLEQEPDYPTDKISEKKADANRVYKADANGVSKADAMLIPQEPITSKLVNFDSVTDKLHIKVKPFFENNKILIKTLTIIKNGSEIEYTVNVPSAIGSINHYCKAKSKKKINDTDLTSAYLAGQMKKMPVIFITNGVLSKKAKDMLNVDFQNMKVIAI
jgi:hypothetical protein